MVGGTEAMGDAMTSDLTDDAPKEREMNDTELMVRHVIWTKIAEADAGQKIAIKGRDWAAAHEWSIRYHELCCLLVALKADGVKL